MSAETCFMNSNKDTLQPTYFFDYDHVDIQNIVKDIESKKLGIVEKAIYIYELVRDGWVYNPYNLKTSRESLRASYVVNLPYGHCIDKAVLMITLARACGIPAILHLAKVTNHIGVEKLIEKMGTAELTPHGYVELFLNDKWVKATPSFNRELCDKIGVDVLQFDGVDDSIFQEFDKKGSTFMRYLDDYGTFNDLPHKFIHDKLKEYYPHIIH